MVSSYINAAEAAGIRSVFRALEDTIQTVFWDVTWVAWAKVRPQPEWQQGTVQESWFQLNSGTGRLSENGKGGPVIGQDVIFQQAPFRLRTLVSADLTGNMWLVVDGTRLFKVEGFMPRAGDRQHANAYLSEVFGADLPEVPTP